MDEEEALGMAAMCLIVVIGLVHDALERRSQRMSIKDQQLSTAAFNARGFASVQAVRYDSSRQLPKQLEDEPIPHGSWLLTDGDGAWWWLPPNIFNFLFKRVG